MFKDLPEELQAKILVYLQADQFQQAKVLVDAYYNESQPIQPQLAAGY